MANMNPRTIEADFDRYLELCTNDVRDRIGISFSREDNQGRPILDPRFSKDGWTFECLAQVSILHEAYEFQSLLTELYYDDPHHLFEISKMSRNMCHSSDRVFDDTELTLNQINGQKSESAEIRRLRDDFPAYVKPAFELPQYQRFLTGHLPLHPGVEKSFESLALITSFAVVKRLNDSRAFQMFMADERPMSEIRDHTGGATPFEAGLRLIFCEELERFQESLVLYIERKWFSTGDDETLAEENSQRTSKSPFDAAHTQLLFAPSGSGKTECIFAELKRKYGYYIVSSALERGGDADSSGLGRNIFDPKVLQGVSGDTRELFKLMRCIRPLSFESKANRFIIGVFWFRIIEARCRVFRAFRKAGNSKSSPELWLRFQLKCYKWDPFSYIFRALSLLFRKVSTKADSMQILIPGDLCKDDIVQWVCLDEAQEDLIVDDDSMNMLEIAMVGDDFRNMLEITMVGLLFLGFCRQAIFAGTSLNLRKAIESRSRLDRLFNLKGRLETTDLLPTNQYWKWNSYKSVLDFRLVMDKSNLKSALRDCGLKSQKILDIAAEHGSALFGRIKWTAMYAESILTGLKNLGLSDSDTHTDDDYNELNLRHLADKTYETVISHLIDKLRTIEERGDGSELLDQLLEAAISADIRGLPHVFQHDSDMELVNRGFAMVGTKIDQISINLEQYFTIVTKKTNLLEAHLTNPHDVEAGTIYLLSQAAQNKFSISGCTVNAITPEIATSGVTIVDCLTNKMDDQQKQGYIRKRRAKRQSELEKKLSGWNFSIQDKTDHNLFARLKEGTTLDTKTADEVNSYLEKLSYININIPIAELSTLVRESFSIEQSTLVGELKERVVIDAILRFFDSKLNDKLIHYIKGLSTKTGLGHPSEYFLAIQLRQFFTSSPNNADRLGEEWVERRQRVRASLAQAENGLGNRSSQITDLKESTLVSGDRAVMKFDPLNNWITEFSAWLTAIEKGFKPCASFLLPHNDFGPDLIFALRTETGNIILCSIQLKLGGGTLDAVNKSSTSWACVGRLSEIRGRLKTSQNRLQTLQVSEEELKATMDESLQKQLVKLVDKELKETRNKIGLEEFKNETDNRMMKDLAPLETQLRNSFWSGQYKLSLLIAAGQHIPEDLKNIRPNTCCDEKYEYYSYITGEVAAALFGQSFMEYLEVLDH